MTTATPKQADDLTARVYASNGRVGAKVGEHFVGVIRDGRFYATHMSGEVATGLRPEVVATGRYYSTDSATESRRFAAIRAARHVKFGAMDRIFVIIIGGMAIVEVGPKHECWTSRPVVVDLATARKMWSELA